MSTSKTRYTIQGIQGALYGRTADQWHKAAQRYRDEAQNIDHQLHYGTPTKEEQEKAGKAIENLRKKEEECREHATACEQPYYLDQFINDLAAAIYRAQFKNSLKIR